MAPASCPLDENDEKLGLLTTTIVYSGSMDILLAILPWKIVWKVAIHKREKFGALVAMSMGVLYVLFDSQLSTHTDRPLLSSSGIIAFMKIISLKDISDSSCKSTTVNTVTQL